MAAKQGGGEVTDSELNEAVARKLVVECFDCGRKKNHPKEGCNIPTYSTDIAAAWEILERLNHSYNAVRWIPSLVMWECVLNATDPKQPTIVRSDTAPRAICEAFLKLP